MSDGNQDTYTITIKNAPENTSYALYLDGIPKILAGGKTQGSSYSFKASNQFTGSGKIKFSIPMRSRTQNGIPFAVEVDANGQDLTIDVTPFTPSQFRRTNQETTGDKSFLQNKLQQQVQQNKEQIEQENDQSKTEEPDKKKSFLQNKLKEQVVERKNQLDQTGKSFWDKFK